MKTFTKIAFVDENTEEYYVGENQNGNSLFSKDITRAKLYVPQDQIRDFFENVTVISKRNLKCVEIEITLKDNGYSDILNQIDKKEFELYERLNNKANQDLDGMTERDYRKWKSLNVKYRSMV
jgi:hypothetical protein